MKKYIICLPYRKLYNFLLAPKIRLRVTTKAIFLIMLGLSCNVLFINRAFSENEDIENLIKHNPDGKKYEFVKNYIKGLSYLKLNSQRTQESLLEVTYDFGGEELEKTLALRADLILDNTNLRVARNFLKQYRTPENGLILKITDLFEKFCNEQIDFNMRERKLIDALYEVQKKRDQKKFNKLNFAKTQEDLFSQRRQSFKKLLEASMLVTKMLISNKQDWRGDLTMIGITEEERMKLLFQLDGFYGDQYEGQIREGQTFLEASISVIREFLEEDQRRTLDG